jgi:hypothetical protein
MKIQFYRFKKRIDDMLSRIDIDDETVQLVTLYGNDAVLTDEQPMKAR